MAKAAAPTVHQDPVHIRLEEKITLTGNRDGGLQNLEVHGLITLKITAEELGRIKLGIENNDNKGIQLQVFSNNIDLSCWRILLKIK
jgi:hypothetical protein